MTCSSISPDAPPGYPKEYVWVLEDEGGGMRVVVVIEGERVLDGVR